MDWFGDLLAAPFLCIGWIIAGAIAGAIAHSITGSRAPLLTDIIIGLIGFAIGAFIVGLLGLERPSVGLTGYIVSIVVGVIGAIVLILIYRAVTGRRVA